MRGVLSLTFGTLAAATTAANANSTCAKGLYILCAPGLGESVLGPSTGSLTRPDNTGLAGVIALEIQKQIEGSVIAGVIYAATEPSETSYYESEGNEAKAVLDDVNQYHSACPNSKIALIGYSQGAQAVQDALCGGVGGQFNSEAPLSPELVQKNVVAIARIADPTHIANTTYDHGTGVHDGVVFRKNTTVCKQYSSLMGSWCGYNDVYCDSGNNQTEHSIASLKYKTDVVNFVVGKWSNTVVKSDSSPAPRAPTASPTNTSSGKTNSASGFSVTQNLPLAAGILLVVLSLH